MYHEKTILHIILFLTSFIGFSYGQSTDDCGKKYGCFLSPSGCQNSSCDYTVKWAKLNDNAIQFIIGTPADYESYLAIGFSYDQIMGNDSVPLCKLSNAVNVSTVENYFDNKKHTKPEIVNSTYRSIGLSSMSVSYTDGRLICSFQRQIRNDSFGPKFFDLNKMYYLLVAKGPLKSSYEPGYHNDDTAYSSKQIDFRKVNNEQVGDQLFTKLHAFIKGIIMLFAWMILSTIGVLIARYFKTIYSDKKPCGVDFWFAVHRSFMVCVPILTIIGFLTVFYEKNWTFVEPGFTKSFIHALFGTLTLLMALVQPVVASFRPGKNDRSRPLFNWFHRIIGIGSFVFSHVAIFLGVYIYINSLVGWTIVTIWLFWLVLLVFVIEINTRFVISDEEDYLINNDASQHEVKNRKVEKKAKINSIMFIVHIIIAALVFSALLSFIIADL